MGVGLGQFLSPATPRSVILAFAELLPFKILSLDDSVVKPDRNGIIKDQTVLKRVATLPRGISENAENSGLENAGLKFKGSA